MSLHRLLNAILFTALVALTIPPVHSQSVPPPEQLSLEHAIRTALSHNLGFSRERLNAASSLEEITIEDAAFDPTLTGRLNHNDSLSPQASSTLAGANTSRSDSRAHALAANKAFSTGTEVTLSTNLNRSSSNSSNALLNPDYSAETRINLRQPLLKGFGQKVNLAPLARAIARDYLTRLQIRDAALALIAETETRYWALAVARQEVTLRQSTLDLAQTLLDEIRERHKVGLATKVDELQALAEVATAQESLLVAKKNADDAQDELLRILGTLPDTSQSPILWQQYEVAPLPQDTPQLEAFGIILGRALEHDLNSAIQKENLSIRRIESTEARNNRLPQLDLAASGAYLGRDNDFGTAYQNVSTQDGYNWSLGLEISIPWELRAERARYRQAQIREKQAQQSLEDIRQQLVLNVRQAWRSVQIQQERLTSAEAAHKLRAEAYIQELARYETGISTVRNTLQAQRDLDDASLRALRARQALINARIELTRLDHTLLDTHGFSWEELALPKPPPTVSLPNYDD